MMMHHTGSSRLEKYLEDIIVYIMLIVNLNLELLKNANYMELIK